jgi:molybdenum cofactor synthesis domain-containing protein
MISLTEARAHVLSTLVPLAPQVVPLADALGCVLAEDVEASEAIPPFANTAMDGFAVRAADTVGATDEAPTVLTVVATLAAGQAPSATVGPGEAIRIMTGAPMPDGADAVVMVERTQVADDDATVLVLTEVPPGNHVRPAGDDLQPGQPVFGAGDVLTPGHLGVLASLGRQEVRVVPRARVGVFSTGDELVEGPQRLEPGQIRDSNRITLLSLLAQSGCEGVDLGRIPDDPDAIAAAIEAGAATCDALLTSGGVSMGDFDYVKVVLDRVGDMRWMQVAIRPAKPLAFGTVAGPDEGAPRVPVFGLPGNPVSSMVSFELFARPGLRLMMGRGADDLDRPHVLAVADEPLARRPDGKVHLDRVVARYDDADGAYHVRSAGQQGSHHLTAMATADALAVLPDGDAVAAGETVRVMLLGPR